jgi:hypothetical protein
MAYPAVEPESTGGIDAWRSEFCSTRQPLIAALRAAQAGRLGALSLMFQRARHDLPLREEAGQ